MGLGYVPQHTLTTLNAVYIPDGVDDLTVRKKLLQEYNIEIGAGLGPFKGKVWRFGLMGSSSTKQNVMLVLAALGEILYQLGKLSDPGVGLAAASDMQTVA
jgi:alanine-glyoxylate transaminase/serine-glyoxylate transaminase/serine-pyruvate transaminase